MVACAILAAGPGSKQIFTDHDFDFRGWASGPGDHDSVGAVLAGSPIFVIVRVLKHSNAFTQMSAETRFFSSLQRVFRFINGGHQVIFITKCLVYSGVVSWLVYCWRLSRLRFVLRFF